MISHRPKKSSGRATSPYQRDPSASHSRNFLIIDDHPIASIGLANLLEGHSEFSCRCLQGGCDQALKLIDEHRPSLVIVDIACDCGGGLTLLRQIRTTHPRVNTLVYTAHNEKTFARRALLAGASGFLSKHDGPSAVIEAVHRVLSGNMHYSSDVISSLDGSCGSDPSECLSERELEVFIRIGSGEGNRTIARELSVKPKTIESFREKIKAKLGLHDSVELVQHAVRWVIEQERDDTA